MQEFIKSRRDIDEPPGKELKDYEEYAHLYALAWSDPLNRWLLSTLPSLMIFDDHDVRDDWNTSYAWQQEIRQTSWWHERIVSGLASYWVYQHVGNLSPDERAADPVWQRIVAHAEAGGDDELDLTQALDDLAERVDEDPTTYRWSYAREFAGVRLVVVDSRAARVLEPDRRSLLDDDELAWLDEPDARRREAPVRRHVAAVPAPDRPALPGGVERGRRQRRVGPEVRDVRREAASQPWTSSTGARSSTRSTRWRRWPRRLPTAAGARRRRP